MIKAHCMGMEFPKRDTDSPNVRWATTEGLKLYAQIIEGRYKLYLEATEGLPTAADLDAVAEEQRVRDKTGI